MDEHEAIPPGLLDSLRQLGGRVLGIFKNRLELLLVELQEDRVRLFEALVLVGALGALGFCTLGLLVAGAIVLTWAKFGVAGLFVLSGITLIGTVLVGWRLSLRLKNWPLLSGTLEELKKDLECLENK